LEVKILQTPAFNKQYKKLDKPVRKETDDAIRQIVDDPKIGEEKKGDLAGIFVFKFKYKTQQYLLAYAFDEFTRQLRAIGVHENFYRDLNGFNALGRIRMSYQESKSVALTGATSSSSLFINPEMIHININSLNLISQPSRFRIKNFRMASISMPYGGLTQLILKQRSMLFYLTLMKLT
jgi:mRNA interferase RelE/StbE